MYTTRFLDLPPLSAIGGTLRVPGSKSISNRALFLAGFASGTTAFDGLLHSDDTRVMLDALVQLGCRTRTEGDRLSLTGLGGRPGVARASLHLGNAGTAMRPLVAALAISAPAHAAYELHGTARMHERPIGDLVDALRALGCRIDFLGRDGYPPLAIGAASADALAGGSPVRVRGDVSSQFLTALLLALPLRASTAAAVIEVEGELISRPYVDITLRLLQRFGVSVEREEWRRFTLPGGQAPRSPGTFTVEGDASSASYFIAAATVAAGPGGLRIEGSAATRSRATSPSSMPHGPWVRGSRPLPDASRCTRPPSPGADLARLQPHPRRGDDARGAGPLRRRPLAAREHRQLARQGDRSPRCHGR